MNTTELKKHIQEELEHIDDKHVLEGIGRFIELNIDDDEVYVIPEDLKDKLERSDKQIDNGNFISHTDLKDKISKWLIR